MNCRIRALLVATVAAVAACGCSRREGDRDRDRSHLFDRERKDPNEQDRAGVTTLTGASWVANDTAIDRIVASRCAREVTCSNIGPDRPFTSGEICVREVKKRLAEDLHAAECPGGIDGNELDECLDAIRNESCTSPLDTIARLAACRTGELCRKAEMPHR